jgi:DNA-binding CsgD family transcriptional regulator
MSNAFSIAYPPQRTLLEQVFSLVIDPVTYLRVGHLFLMFPLGIAYFVFLIVGFAFGGSLVWTFPGAAILLATIFLSRYMGDIEAKAVAFVAGVEVRRPPWRIEGIEGWRGRLWARLIDPTTWSGMVYLIAQFPIGIGVFVAMIMMFGLAGSFVVAPAIVLFTDDTLELTDSPGFHIVVDSPADGLWMVPVGLLMLLVSLHIVTVFSALHAMWAQLMLGSRTDPARTTGPSSGPPADPDPGLPTARAEPEQTEPETSPREPESPVIRPFSAVPQPPPIAQPPPSPPPAVKAKLEQLTPREREVVLLVAEGMTNAEIAEKCVISQGTVKTHMKRILAKLELRDRAQVVVYAYEAGVVSPRAAMQHRSMTGF